jgi:hypothetical protein
MPLVVYRLMLFSWPCGQFSGAKSGNPAASSGYVKKSGRRSRRTSARAQKIGNENMANVLRQPAYRIRVAK